MLTRRSFVALMSGLSAGVLPVLAANNEGSTMTKEHHQEEEISAVEDLMREHGILDRMLLIYESGIQTLSKNQAFPREVIASTADLVKRFIEDYHGQLEEQHVFPRFQKAGKMVDLVQILKEQHDAGRKLTGTIITITGSDATYAAGRATLLTSMSGFIRMFRPHEAREDTVLFPAFRSIVPEKEYKSLGEQFEEEEHKLFGEGGFHSIVEQIAELEKRIGIHDLNQFTA